MTEHAHTWGALEFHPRLGGIRPVRYCTAEGCEAFTTRDDDEDARYDRAVDERERAEHADAGEE